MEKLQKFGKWTILNNQINIDKYKTKRVLCQCECGKEGFVILNRLKRFNNQEGCKSCSNRTNKKWKGNGVGELSGTFYNCMKKQAKSRNYTFNVSKQFLWDLYLKQEQKCALSGIPLLMSKKLKKRTPDWSLITASLDRVNNSKGYEEDNVQWVHKTINIMKNSIPNDLFIHFCNCVYKNNVNFEPSIVNENEKVTMTVQRLIGEEFQPINLTRASSIL